MLRLTVDRRAGAAGHDPDVPVVRHAADPRRPIRQPQTRGRIFWLGEASAVLLTDDLNAFGTDAITRQERLQAFERLQVPPVAALTDATVIRIGQLVGAARVVVGSLQMENDALVVRARSITLDTGRVQVDVTERARCRTCSRSSSGSRGASRHRRSAAEEIARQQPPVAVFEDFIKGLLAETPATAINYLNSALKQQPSFDRARLALWECLAEQGDHRTALRRRHPSRRFRHGRGSARFLAGVSQLQLKSYDDAFATFNALAEAQPTPTVLNNLGVVQLRRGATAQTGVPTLLLHEGGRGRSGRPGLRVQPGLRLLGESRSRWRRSTGCAKPCGAIRPMATRTSCSRGALAAQGEIAESTRASANWRGGCRRPMTRVARRPGGEAVPKGLERVKNEVELPHARDRDEAGGERAARSGAARDVLPRSRPPAVSARERSRGGRRTEPRAVHLAVSRRRTPAARADTPAQRKGQRSDRRLQGCGLER